MKKKQITKIIIVALLIILALATLFIFIFPKTNKEEEVIEETSVEVVEVVDDNTIEDDGSWAKYYEINNDYVGHIYFESNIINLPFVQGDSNETYFRKDWESLKYDEEGSIFMDYRNDIDNDQNVIIYGHYVYPSYEPSKTHKFTPLHLLLDEENYEENKYIYLNLKDRLEKYEVAIVYRCKIDVIDGEQYINDDEPAFYCTAYSEEEFADYLKGANERSYYDTGVDLSYDDKLITLQTCYEGSPDKLIVCAKLIETKYKK